MNGLTGLDFSTLIQGGSFGLLCFIIYWASVYLPKRADKNDALRESEIKSREAMVKAFQEVVDGINRANAVTIDKCLATFKDSSNLDREECERKHEQSMDQMLKTHDIVREVRHEIGNIAQHRANERALNEMNDRNKRRGQSPETPKAP